LRGFAGTCLNGAMISEELLRALADADFGDWSEPVVTDIVTGLGWTAPAETDRYQVAWERADGAQAIAPRTEDYDRRYEFGDLRQLRIEVPVDDVTEAYRHLTGLAEDVLGPVHHVGGPDAYLRWRRQPTSVELSRSIRYRTITMMLERTESAEWYAHSLSRGGACQEYAWRASPAVPEPYDAALAGTMYYSAPDTDDWHEFGDHLDDVFRSLADDVPALAPWVEDVVWTIGTPTERFVQGWFAADRVRFEIGGGDGGTEKFDLPVSGDSGREVARRVTALLAEWGVDTPERLTTEAWSTRKGTFLEKMFRAPGR
jgi:hypothetical protein